MYIMLGSYRFNDIIIIVAANIFKSKGIPTRISTELESRLAKAGFVNEKLEITPLPINHNGKRGELLW
jgi:hypothetical protein